MTARSRLTPPQLLRVSGAPPPAVSIDTGWRLDAACVGQPADLWFPADRVGSGFAWRKHAAPIATSMCDGCPVRAECLTTHRDEAHGIFGGLHVEERRSWVRLHGLPRPWHHGDEAGAKRHRRAGETVCHSCLAGARLAAIERTARHRRQHTGTAS